MRENVCERERGGRGEREKAVRCSWVRVVCLCVRAVTVLTHLSSIRWPFDPRVEEVEYQV